MIWYGATRLTGITRSCGGLWRFLIARVKGRTAVELERERNLATARAITLLPPGAELLENEPCGRLRVIRIPAGHPTRSPAARELPPGQDGELTR